MANDSERSSDCIVTYHAYCSPPSGCSRTKLAPQRPYGCWERRVAAGMNDERPAGLMNAVLTAVCQRQPN